MLNLLTWSPSADTLCRMVNAQRALACAVRLARKAGEIQLKHLGRVGHITYKGPIDIVTEVDKKCEKLIVGGIKKIFPDHDILAEEGSGKRSRSDYRWIIDPVDGTVNYAHGFRFFCVSIALEWKGEVVVGVVYDPNRDELFSAIKGRGTFLNGVRAHVALTPKLGRALLATGFSYDIHTRTRSSNLDHWVNFIRTAQAVRRPGSAAIDLAWLAAGRIDGFWELSLKAWDMAAGIILIREAGGRVTAFDGGSFDLYGSEILASNGRIHREMMGVLTKGKRA